MTDLIALAKQAGAYSYTSKYEPGRTFVSFSPELLQAFADLIRKESEAERDRLREALTDIIASWDSRSFEKEVFKTHAQLPDGYWSPSASMVDSSAIAVGRQALEEAR